MLLRTHAAGPIGFVSLFEFILRATCLVVWCVLVVFCIMRVVFTLWMRPGVWRDTRFNLCAWSLIFPLGALTKAAVEFGCIMDSSAFAVLSTALLICSCLCGILIIFLCLAQLLLLLFWGSRMGGEGCIFFSEFGGDHGGLRGHWLL
jgi:tellurite resistance protein TehA-like permease